MSEQLGISIQEMTCDCDQRDLVLDQLCPDCAEQKEARDAHIAHQIVDECEDYYVATFRGTVLKAVPDKNVANGGSVAEPRPLSVARDAESGHDWVSSLQRISDRKIRIRVVGEWNDERVVVEEIDGEERAEFLDPISVITDRTYDLETSVTVTANETICQDCHYLHNSAIKCPNCN